MRHSFVFLIVVSGVALADCNVSTIAHDVESKLTIFALNKRQCEAVAIDEAQLRCSREAGLGFVHAKFGFADVAPTQIKVDCSASPYVKMFEKKAEAPKEGPESLTLTDPAKLPPAAKLKNLKKLSLWSPDGVSKKVIPTLAELTALEDLQVYFDDGVTLSDIAPLAKLTGLRRWAVDGLKLGEGSLDLVAKLPHIARVDLEVDQLTEAAKKKLAAMHFTCKHNWNRCERATGPGPATAYGLPADAQKLPAGLRDWIATRAEVVRFCPRASRATCAPKQAWKTAHEWTVRLECKTGTETTSLYAAQTTADGKLREGLAKGASTKFPRWERLLTPPPPHTRLPAPAVEALLAGKPLAQLPELFAQADRTEDEKCGILSLLGSQPQTLAKLLKTLPADERAARLADMPTEPLLAQGALVVETVSETHGEPGAPLLFRLHAHDKLDVAAASEVLVDLLARNDAVGTAAGRTLARLDLEHAAKVIPRVAELAKAEDAKVKDRATDLLAAWGKDQAAAK